MTPLGAQPADALVGVVAGQSSKVHAGYSSQKPSRLPVFLHGSTSDLGLRATFHCASVHPNVSHPIEIERDAFVGQKGLPGKGCHDTAVGIAIARTASEAFRFVAVDWHGELYGTGRQKLDVLTGKSESTSESSRSRTPAVQLYGRWDERQILFRLDS